MMNTMLMISSHGAVVRDFMGSMGVLLAMEIVVPAIIMVMIEHGGWIGIIENKVQSAVRNKAGI